MSCDVGQVTERFENELRSFRHFTYVTTHSSSLLSLYLLIAHSSTLPLSYLRHSSISNPFVASPMSQFILQPFRCFPYVTAHSPSLSLLHLRHSSFSNPFVAYLRHSSFSNPYFASPTSQAHHLIHLASRP